MKLTKKIIDKATYPEGHKGTYIIWDQAVSGLGLRIQPSNKKAWTIVYRQQGKQRYFKIGNYPQVTLDNARKSAKWHFGEVAQGRDPAEARKRERQELTMSDLCKRYLSEHAKPRKKSWKEDERKIERRIKPTLGKRKAIEIKRSDLMKLHRKVGQESPYEANRLLAVLSVIFAYGRRANYLPEDHVNPTRDIEKYKERARTRWLEDEDEFKILWQAIEADSNVYYRAFFKLLILTGMRKGELQNLKWEQIDLKTGVIRLTDTKSGYSETKQLSPPAIEILKEIPGQSDNPFVFPSETKPGQALINLDKPWRRIKKRAKVEDLRIHDLRRTFVSLMANNNVSLEIASKAVGHRSTRVTEAVYARFRDDPIRQAVNQIGEKIIDINMIKNKKSA